MPLLKPDDTGKTFNFATTAETGKIGAALPCDISTRNGTAVKTEINQPETLDNYPFKVR